MSLIVDIKKRLGSFSLSAQLEAGEGVTGILGSSGCGKSMTLKCIAGIERPDSGHIELDGVVLYDSRKRIDLHPQQRRVGYLFQNYALFPNMTLRQNILCGLRNQTDKAQRVKEADDMIAMMGLQGLEKHRPYQLSGGQQRRVAFAGVLAMEPEVLVLDEPMAGLDPAARRDFLGLIDRLHREGLTVVMVSHSMDDLANCCDRIVVMNEGAVFAEGTPAQVFAHADELKSIGLGVPAAQRMALALAKAGVPLRFDGLYTVESLADELVDLLIGRSGGPSNVADIAKSKTVAREEGC